jgi:hypothetical protein
MGHALSSPPIMSPSVNSVALCCRIALHCSGTRGWSAAQALHCSHIVSAYPHVLQALVAMPARTSCRPMIALTSGALETCARALGTGEPCRTGRPTRLFFVLDAHGPQGVVGRAGARSPPRREAGSEATGHVVRRSPPSRFGAMVHVVVLEPFSPGRWVP